MGDVQDVCGYVQDVREGMWTTYEVDIECAVRKDIWVTTRYGDEDNGDGDDCDGDEGVEDAGAGDDAGDGMVSFILEAALNSYMYTRGTHLRPPGIDSPSD